MEVGAAMEEQLAFAETGGEGTGADVAVVVARVADDDFDGRAVGGLVDEETVGGAAFALVEAAEGLVLWQAGEEAVLADEVPVAHPGRAEVADCAVVGEGSSGGELFGNAVGECVGLRDGEEGCAGADGVEDA